MKTLLKPLAIALGVTAMLSSCNTKERDQLRAKVDSLEIELQNNQEMAQTLEEVGSLIDSIDASRQLLRTDVVEGTSYADYSSRLRGINQYVNSTRSKLDELEANLKKSKSASSSYAATIKRLKADLEGSTNQIAALTQEVEKMRTENETLAMTVNNRDSVITKNQEVIQMREQDIASLETRVDEVSKKATADQADLYFAQAQALETAADRTKFAPRKKKETQREALELYRLSLSLGKSEAQTKVDELEKEVG